MALMSDSEKYRPILAANNDVVVSTF